VDLDHAEKQRIIDSIICGDIFVEYNNKIYTLKAPNSRIRSFSNFIYNKEFKKAKEGGIMTSEELLNYYNWYENKEMDIKILTNQIKEFTKQLIGMSLSPNKLKSAKQMVRELNHKLINTIQEKHNLTMNSAENHASTAQQRYIVSQITFINDSRLWPTQESFDDCDNYSLINYLTKQYFIESNISVNILRILARTNPWRGIWMSNKNDNPFDRGPCDWSENQKNLVYWSRIYDMVYDSYERPPSNIIDDDLLLDSWFNTQADKIESKAKQDAVEKLLDKGKKNKNSKPGRKEHFIVASKEEANEIYKLNNPSGKIHIKTQNKAIQEKGKLPDEKTPMGLKEQREKLMEGGKSNVKRAKK
jgi:hypothetical protein